MIDAIEKSRLAQLERCIPDIWSHKSYLYIGAGSYRHHFFERMQEKNLNVDVVEIDKGNCLWLIREQPWICNVYHYDIVDFLERISDEKGKISTAWDVIIWSHGIEMLPKDKSGLLFMMLDVCADRLIVHMTPYGRCGGTGNVSVWYPEDFSARDYTTDTLGKRDQRNSNLLAWRVV